MFQIKKSKSNPIYHYQKLKNISMPEKYSTIKFSKINTTVPSINCSKMPPNYLSPILNLN